MTFSKEQTAMMRSTDRIRVSHAGALPRPTDLQQLFEAGPADQDAFTQALPEAVAEVVDQQVTAGVDVVNDGEISKRGLFIGYIRDRMGGVEARRFPPGAYTPPNAGAQGRDHRDFPGFFAAGLGGFQFGAAVTPPPAPGGARPQRGGTTPSFGPGPLPYPGPERARADIGRLQAAVAGRDGVEAFLPAVTP